MKLKLVIITGTSQGLGKAFFDHFSRQDYAIFAIARRFLPEQHELQQKDPHKYILELQDLAKLGSRTLNKLKRVLKNSELEQLVFINNAGIIDPIGTVGNLDEAALKKSIAVNLTAPLLITNCLFSDALDYRQVTIINISSGAATTPIEGWPAYCTVKAGVKMFFDVLKVQNLKNPKVTVENIDPGIIDTGMQASIRSSSSEQFPFVEKFRKYKEENMLQSAGEVASKIVSKIINQ